MVLLHVHIKFTNNSSEHLSLRRSASISINKVALSSGRIQTPAYGIHRMQRHPQVGYANLRIACSVLDDCYREGGILRVIVHNVDCDEAGCGQSHCSKL